MATVHSGPATRAALRFVVGLLALAPALYLLVAVQYAAITVPFWDHAELIRVIQAHHEGSLKLSDLWQPHNHSRPFTYRIVYLVNAVLTGWDVRSEYVFMLLSIYAAFAIHLKTLYKLDARHAGAGFACCAAVLSVFFFSPVGHNNHWWSMMLQLNLASLFITYALLRVPFGADRWRAHAAAAIACWLATYTLTNGLIAFLAVICALWLAQYPRLKPDRYIVFWLGNLALVLTVYLPGLPSEPGARPSLASVLVFCLVYIGAPLGGLIRYPYHGNFDIPGPLLLNAACGVLLISFAAWLLWRGRGDVRKREPSALILLLLFLFAIGSAMVTAWGRAAFDAYGMANANGSRYSIFSSYLIFGVVYRIAGLLSTEPTGIRPQQRNMQRIGTVVMLTVTVLATVTYARARHVYAAAHDFNRQLAAAYQVPGPSDLDKYIFPDPRFVENLKSALMRLELGPYRDIPSHRVDIVSTRHFVAPVPLSAAARIVQRFKAHRNGLKGIDVETVTHGKRHGSVDVVWNLYEVADGVPRLYAAGVIPAGKIRDWQMVRLRVGPVWDSAGKDYELTLEAARANDGKAGFPAYEASGRESSMELVDADGTRRTAPGLLNASLIYVR